MPMSTWNVTLTKRACKQLLKLPADIQDLADMAIADLETQGPVIRGWDVRKMAAQEYRVRLTYRYRMRYHMLAEGALEIEIFYVGHRKDAYK
jgi:mRNA-degrading endonuclease RelE of RelBE toxin-antitoxin system